MLDAKIKNIIICNSIFILSNSGQQPTADKIRQIVKFAVDDPTLINSSEISMEDKENIAREIEAKYGLTQDLGNMIVGDDDTYAPWLAFRKAEIDPYYWERYKKFLFKESFPPNVIENMDRVTEQILDYLQNPHKGGSWYRRGMVVGHVQSGKTANFLGVINKAADAGYKLIIILAGIIENLRQQTQIRIDEGFVGKESFGMGNRFQTYVGVGSIDSTLIPLTLTDSSVDFRKNTNVDPKMYQTPTILIVKKNARILNRLAEWLKKSNTDQAGKIQDLPLLMIDDEADNASINLSTNGEDTPSAINANIRNILELFNRKCYVAYTATPFANIFIDPESDLDMYGNDLFPKDFIKSLDPPSNYFGPGRIFSSSSGPLDVIRIVDDIESIIPQRHKKTLIITELPNSLKRAVLLNILTKAIKILKGMATQHHSMLVHISRYVDVQEQLKDLVNRYVALVVGEVRLYAKLPESKSSKSDIMKELSEIWHSEFPNSNFEWLDIKANLLNAAASIQVYSINSRSTDQLKYKDYKETGLNVIVVGGDRLSRGLTLENLTVSYFFRNTSMYDTLMQMGRWFGFRPGYEELCRIYMSSMTESYFNHINDVVEELRNEFKIMERLRKTPKDFGLKVRRHPSSLLITARNKMRSAQVIKVNIDLTGRAIESYVVHYNSQDADKNMETLLALLSNMGKVTSICNNAQNNYFWGNVPCDIIQQFITSYVNHPSSIATSTDPVLRYLFQIEHIYPVWDVVLINRADKSEDSYYNVTPSVKVGLQDRTCKQNSDGIEIGSNRRVGNTNAELAGMTNEEIMKARELAGDAELSGLHLRWFRARPLLMLHLIKPRYKTDDRKNSSESVLFAYGLSFPHNDKIMIEPVEYAVNTIYAKQDFTIDDIEDTDDEE